MSYEEPSEQGTASNGDELESSSSRNVSGSHGQQPPALRNEENTPELSADEREDDWAGNPQSIVERSVSYQGPLPHSSELANYESLSPGAATKLIDAHVYEKNAAANALTRVTRAEAFGVSAGVVISGLLVLGGLASGVFLVMADKPLAAAFFGALPVLGGAATGIISAVKGNGK